MKVFILFVIATLVIVGNGALSEDQKTLMKQFYNECVDKTQVDKDLITRARKNDFVENENLMQYYHCMMLKMGVQDEDGTVHADKIIAKLPDSMDKEEGSKIVTKCTKNEEGVAPHKVSFKIYKCFLDSVGKEINLF